LEPLLEPEMLEETKKYVNEFLEGSGPSLQEELHRLDEENSKGSWLSGLWETMYLENRDPHPINVSPFFVLSPFARMKDPLQVLAALIRSTASFHHLVRTGNLGPDMAKGQPLCAHQLPRFLASSCIPGRGRDFYMTELGANHITLNLQGHMFVFQVMNDDGEIISQELCVKAIKKCFKDIQRKEGDGMDQMIPMFTSTDRETWAQVREELSEANGNQFNAIDTSIAVFNLAEGEPGSLEEASQIAMAPPLGWFDKLQFNVMQNGQVSLNMQHAACDGHTLLSLLRHIRSELVLGGGVGSGEQGRDNGPGATQADDEKFVKQAKPIMLEFDVSGLGDSMREVLEKTQE
jgi:carnitine O-acetyltransferase